MGWGLLASGAGGGSEDIFSMESSRWLSAKQGALRPPPTACGGLGRGLWLSLG